jgi:non-ribosomal peptide synthetase component E (peptide arylation enzyme)
MAAREIPLADTCVTEHVLGRAPGWGGRPAIVDDASGAVIAYAKLATTVRAAAAGLARRGMLPGDVAGVHVASAANFALATLAIRAAGGAPAPISPEACPVATGMLLAGCDARILITDTCLVSVSLDIAGRSRVRQLICFGEGSEATRFDSLLGTQTMRPLPVAAGDVAIVVARAGADGEPELVRVTHHEVIAQLRRLAPEAKLAECDTAVIGPPHGDGRGYSAALDLMLACGATVVGAPSASAADLLAAARAHHGAVAFAPPGTQLPDGSLRLITVA